VLDRGALQEPRPRSARFVSNSFIEGEEKLISGRNRVQPSSHRNLLASAWTRLSLS
jgi:hypothetical protein